jgi:hypothetical protein
MFSFFKRSPAPHRASELYAHYTEREKKVILGMMILAAINDTRALNDSEAQFLNEWVEVFQLPAHKVRSYLDSDASDNILGELTRLSSEKKEMALLAIYSIIACDGRPNRKEAEFLNDTVNEVGVSPQQFIQLIEQKNTILDWLDL